MTGAQVTQRPPHPHGTHAYKCVYRCPNMALKLLPEDLSDVPPHLAGNFLSVSSNNYSYLNGQANKSKGSSFALSSKRAIARGGSSLTTQPRATGRNAGRRGLRLNSIAPTMAADEGPASPPPAIRVHSHGTSSTPARSQTAMKPRRASTGTCSTGAIPQNSLRTGTTCTRVRSARAQDGSTVSTLE